MWFDKIEKKNLVVYKDNLQALREMPSGSVDLIYLDPPFFSGRDYNVIWGDAGEVRSFGDRWAGGSELTGLEVYISWMEERVREMYRVLKDTGSFYLHCDWHASHYLKVMCDRIFGYSNFRNEIVWSYKTGGSSKTEFAKKHDAIFFYSKSNKWTFNTQKEKSYTKSKSRKPGVVNYGGGSAEFFEDENGVYNLVNTRDVWEFSYIGSTSPERVGYPTQKPLALLERIIKASSNPGDIVLDPFMGGGTTLVAADSLGRRYIGIDESVAAVRVTEERLKQLHGDKGGDGDEATFVDESKFPEVVNFPHDFDELNNMNAFDFEEFIVTEFGGTPNANKRGDKGIDGWKDDHPIQVKQSQKIGRNVVDNFRSAIQRAKKSEGTIIAFSFGTGAKNEAARLHNEEGIEIALVEAGSIVAINKRPLVSITEVVQKKKGCIITATAEDPDKNDIVLWDWFVDGKNVFTDVVCQRKKKDRDAKRSSFTFKHDGKKEEVKLRAVATDNLGAKGFSRKKLVFNK